MLANRVKETTTTTGTGNLTTAGAATNYQTFNTAFGLNDRFKYWIVDSTNNVWETGIGYLSGTTTLVRETVLDNSSGTQTALNLSAGTKNIFVAPGEGGVVPTMPAMSALTNSEKIVFSQNWNSHADITLTTDRVVYVPFLNTFEGQVDALQCHVETAAGTLLRIGLYEMDADGLPGNIILESSDLDPSTTGVKTSTFTAQHIKPGWYFIAICANGAPIMRGVSHNAAGIMTPIGIQSATWRFGGHIYEANGASWTTLPDPAATTPAWTNAGWPKVGLRVA